MGEARRLRGRDMGKWGVAQLEQSVEHCYCFETFATLYISFCCFFSFITLLLFRSCQDHCFC